MRFHYEGKIHWVLWPHSGVVYLGRAPRHHWFWADWMPQKLGLQITRWIRKLRWKGLPCEIADFVEGIIAGIPVCCTVYFARQAHGRPIAEWYFSKPVNEKAFEKEFPFWLSYIPCPYCKIKGRYAHEMQELWLPEGIVRGLSKEALERPSRIRLQRIGKATYRLSD